MKSIKVFAALLFLFVLVTSNFNSDYIGVLEGCCPRGTPPPPPSTPSPGQPTPPPDGGLPPPPGGGGVGTPAPRPSGGGGPSATRPKLGIGLMPLIQSIQGLLGVAEPWEVWWTKNRDKYFSFRETIEWTTMKDEGGTISVTVLPLYDELLKILEKGVADKDQYIAFRAAVSLGKVQDSQDTKSSSRKAIDILKKAHESETRFFIRNNILLGLGLTGDNESAGIIKDVLENKKDNPPLRRCYAALAAGYLPRSEELSKLLEEIVLNDKEDREVRCCACISLGNLKSTSSIPVLGQILNPSEEKKESPQIRAYAALGLGRIGTSGTLTELQKYVSAKEKEVDVRFAVVMALGLTGLPEAKEAILTFLKDKDPSVQGFACMALAQIQTGEPEKTFEIILEAMGKNKSPDADGLMVIALALTGQEKAKPDLRKILDKENKKPRALLKAAAAIGLGLLKDAEAVPLITAILKDGKMKGNTSLTPYLILALGMIGDQEGVEVLEQMWKNIDKALTLSAYCNIAVALKMLGKKDKVLEALPNHINSKDKILGSYALHSLGLIGDRESAKLFIEAYKDTNPDIRKAVVVGIGFLMDKSSINPVNMVTAGTLDIQMVIMDHILPIPVW